MHSLSEWHTQSLWHTHKRIVIQEVTESHPKSDKKSLAPKFVGPGVTEQLVHSHKNTFSPVLQHTATMCYTLQRILPHTQSHGGTKGHRKTYALTPALQHAATLCYTLQHTLLHALRHRTKSPRKTNPWTEEPSAAHNKYDTNTHKKRHTRNHWVTWFVCDSRRSSCVTHSSCVTLDCKVTHELCDPMIQESYTSYESWDQDSYKKSLPHTRTDLKHRRIVIKEGIKSHKHLLGRTRSHCHKKTGPRVSHELIHTQKKSFTHGFCVSESCICVIWRIHMCDMAHLYLWHDSFICVAWLIPTWDMTHSDKRHDSFMCVTWLIHVCNMTHSYVWHDAFVYVIWLIPSCDMSHSYMRHGSFLSVTWLIHTCDMTHF